MNCWQIQDRLSAYYDNELSPELRVSAAAHLESCPDCTHQFETFRQLTAVSAELVDPPPPSSLWERIEKGLDATGPSVAPPPVLGIRRFPRLLVAVAAVMIVGVSVGIMSRQAWRKPHRHVVAADVNGYFEAFLHDPLEAQRVFLASQDAKTVEVGQPEQRARIQAILADDLPANYSLDAVHVYDLRLCTCFTDPCVCDREICHCVQATYRREDGEMLLVLRHDRDQPDWFRGRPTLHRQCGGKPTKIVQLDESRLAATWRADGAHVTLVGARDIEEVGQWITRLGKQPNG